MRSRGGTGMRSALTRSFDLSVSSTLNPTAEPSTLAHALRPHVYVSIAAVILAEGGVGFVALCPTRYLNTASCHDIEQAQRGLPEPRPLQLLS